MDKTLYEIYSGQGKPLPTTVDARFADPAFAAAAQSAGITKDQYVINAGNAAVNTKIANAYGKTANVPTPATTTAPQANSSPTGGATATPNIAPASTIGDIYGEYNNYLTDPNAYLGSKGVTEANSRAQALSSMQAQIDATNKYYADQLAQAQMRGQGKIGQVGAINARRGLLGSDFGVANTEAVATANRAVEDSINNEKALRIQELLSEAEQSGIERFQAERAAIENGLKTKIDVLKSRQQQVKTGASDAAMQLLAKGYSVSEMSPEQLATFAKGYGTTPEAINNEVAMTAYKTKQEEAARQAEIDTALAKRGLETVSSGNQGYQYNAKTGKYELVANNPKASAGVAGGGAGVAGGSGVYKSDLDAIIGNTYNLIPSANGKVAFGKSISSARNEADKISAVASVVLRGAPATERTDFTNQAVAIKQLDKAISMLDSGIKTGVLQAGTQYTYNIFGKDYDPKLAQINQLVTSAIQPYRNSITGAAWGDQEDGEYASLFGSSKYSPAEFKLRLEGVKKIMTDKTASALNMYVNPVNAYDNVFEAGVNNTRTDNIIVAPDGTQIEIID